MPSGHVPHPHPNNPPHTPRPQSPKPPLTHTHTDLAAPVPPKAPTWLEELVAGHKHRVQHGLTQQEVAHPLTDDDVHLEAQEGKVGVGGGGGES